MPALVPALYPALKLPHRSPSLQGGPRRRRTEDLTVSASVGGYSATTAIPVAARYTEVAARDLALYNGAFAAGGKFYNDNFLNPSIYP